MKMCTVEDLQKNLQVLANQVGSKRFTAAKNLMLEGLVIVDADGNPVDPANIKYEVMLSPAEAAAEEAAVEPAAIVEEPKALADEVAKAVKLELSSKAAAHPITTRKEITVQGKVYSKIKNFKNNDDAYAFGSWAFACMGYKKSAQWCADNGIMTKAPNMEGSNSAGGFLVPESMEQQIITLREKFGVIRNHARVVPMTSDILRMPRRSTNLTASFVGEASTASQTNETFDQVNLVAKKSMVLTRFSTELSEDAVINFADDLAGEMSFAQSKLEDQAAFIGDSTSTYGGITGLATAVGTAGVTTGASNFAGTTLAEIQSCFAKLPQYADNANAKIFCHKAVWNSIFLRLAYVSGGNNAVDLLTGSGQLSFAGYPVVLCQAMNGTTGSGAIAFHFGDASQAVYFGQRSAGTTIDFSNAALSAFEQDMLVYRATTRWDLVCANVGDTSTAGSIVTFKVNS